MSNTRIPQILEKQIQGHTNTQISQDLGVSRKTITRDIQTPLYENLINEFYAFYKDKITELGNSDQITVQLEILKELGRMYRAGMTKHTTHTEDLKVTANINITETRKEKEALLNSLELSPDQWRVLEDSVKTQS